MKKVYDLVELMNGVVTDTDYQLEVNYNEEDESIDIDSIFDCIDSSESEMTLEDYLFSVSNRGE